MKKIFVIIPDEPPYSLCAKSFAKGSLTVMLSVPTINYKALNSLFYSTFPVVETVGLVLKDNKVNTKESYRK